MLSVYAGFFKNEPTFEEDFGHTAGNLQIGLYNGGCVGYSQSSNDFNLYLGADKEIGETQGMQEVKRIQFPGIARPAASLDELLDRIKQK